MKRLISKKIDLSGQVMVLSVALLLFQVPRSFAGEEWKIIADPTNSFFYSFTLNNQPIFEMKNSGWGPNWVPWFQFTNKKLGANNRIISNSPVTMNGKTFNVNLEASRSGSNKVVYEYGLNFDTETELTQICALYSYPTNQKTDVTIILANEQKELVQLPINGSKQLGIVKNLILKSSLWKNEIAVELDPPCLIYHDRGDLRLVLASNKVTAGEKKQKIIWTFPEEISFQIDEKDVLQYYPAIPGQGWFAYHPAGESVNSRIGFENWLEKPSGNHGGIRIKGDRFVFEDGTPIKFWGTNLSYRDCLPVKTVADYTANRFAKYGVNAVRLHKFTNQGEGMGDEKYSTQMKPDLLNQFDYFASVLKEKGIYFGWSHSFMWKIRSGDRDRLVGFSELMKKGGNTYAIINWAEDVQDLMIEMVVGLLKHKNPYTNKTYAEEPSLAFIEFQNEDDIFFWTSLNAYKDYPIYAKMLDDKFVSWLREKYGTEENWQRSWKGGLKPGESLANGKLIFDFDLWKMTSDGIKTQTAGSRQRQLDKAAFLHSVQNQFYGKFEKAIRNAGYKGPLVGSCWQAPSMLPHYYNLRSDDLVGYIDRHNYFGGSLLSSILPTPGGGNLTSGFQQVANKPFGISEWIHVYPSLFSAEGPVLMAAYGMGLQGWDASYEFNCTAKILDPNKEIVGQKPFGVWNNDAPTQIGQFPILARMIHRGDVKEGPVISTRRISPENLDSGEFDFNETVRQQGDIKDFSGAVPKEALAVGRVLLEFVEKTTPSTLPDLTKYINGTVVTSATGQLKWDSADKGHVMINTDGTQGYVGFAKGKKLVFDNLAIEPSTPYASILCTASHQRLNLKNDNRVLISAIARNSNLNFRISKIDNTTIYDNGKPPIMLEPVKADITFTNRKISRVNVLDQDGRLTSRTLPVKDGKFTIDSAKTHTIYYEVELED